jgi:type IV secretory pathway VirJ component
MRRRWPSRIGVAALLAATAVAVWWFRPQPLPDTELVAVADLVRPQGMPRALVFLISGAGGWRLVDAQTARTLSADGAIVVGVDLAKTFARATAEDDDCVYFVSDIEKLSEVIQRSAGGESYVSPIVAGEGVGGSMVLALAAQSPLATIGRFVAVDPGAELPLARQLCSGAPHRKGADGKGWVYEMQAGQLPAPVTVLETKAADPAGQAHVGELVARGFAIERVPSADDDNKAMRVALGKTIAQSAASPVGETLADLPLAVLPAAARHDTMAIVLSGDGGWRDIDRELGEALANAGVPTVGVDSLRYFWKARSPRTIAADLTRIVDHYSRVWNVHHVALIGYSFGADVLPAAYDLLPTADRARVSVVSLLALSRWALFQFDVGGWLGMDGDTSHPTLPDVAKIPAGILQCIFGSDDDESVCEELKKSGAEVIEMDGGHHFDDDYDTLARHIIARIR